MKAIVTVVGQDRVGIIAGVCAKLAEFNVNVLDISQTVMQGYFTMMMAAEVSQCNVPLAELVTRMDRPMPVPTASMDFASSATGTLHWETSTAIIMVK